MSTGTFGQMTVGGRGAGGADDAAAGFL